MATPTMGAGATRASADSPRRTLAARRSGQNGEPPETAAPTTSATASTSPASTPAAAARPAARAVLTPLNAAMGPSPARRQFPAESEGSSARIQPRGPRVARQRPGPKVLAHAVEHADRFAPGT